MTTHSRPPCRSCSASSGDSTTCDRTLPCTACTTAGSTCSYPPPPPPLSAWTTTASKHVQQWAETPRLSLGAIGGGRLRPRRNEEGEVEELKWEEMVGQRQDLRVRRERRGETLLFPPTIDGQEEEEQLDLVGNPATFASDASLFGSLHSLAPNDPFHPTIFLNSTLRAAPTTTYGRVTASFEPFNLNIGNTLAAAHFADPSSPEGSNTGVVWRGAEEASGRPIAVGWGAFAPLRAEERPLSRKGKERAVDQDVVDAADEAPRYPPGAFVPSAKPLFSTSAPIQQLELVSLPSTATSFTSPSSASALLAVRSFTSLSLLRLSLPRPFDTGTPPAIVAQYDYTGADFGGRQLADFALGGVKRSYGELGAGMVVDSEGSLFGWGLGGGGWSGGAERPEMFRLRKGRKKGAREYSGFARVEYGGMKGCGAVVGLEDEVLLYDLRSPRASLTLLDSHLLSSHLPFGTTIPSLLTSLLSPSPSPPSSSPLPAFAPPPAIHTVCTTRDLLWLDERMPGRAVLRWAHNRVGAEGKGVDRTLRLTELPAAEGAEGEGVQRVALSSRVQGLVEVFTTKLDAAEAPRSVLDPYGLLPPSLSSSTFSSSSTPRFTRTGLAFLPLPPFTPSSNPDGPAAHKMDVDSSSDDDFPSGRPPHRRRSASSPSAATAPSRWRMLEVGMEGELVGRELRGWAGRDDGEEEGDHHGEEEVTRRVWSEDVQALAHAAAQPRRPSSGAPALPSLAEPKKPTRRKPAAADLRGIVERLRPEAVVRVLEGEKAEFEVEEEEEEEGEAERVGRKAVTMLGVGAEGEVGALTSLEAFSLASAAIKRSDPDAVVDEEDLDLELSFPALPRDSAYLSTTPSSALPITDGQLVQSAPASILLAPANPPTHFSTFLLRPTPQPSELATSGAASTAISLAAAQTDAQRALASHILLPRPVEPDEPTMAPNQPQPADTDPPPLHFSYFRPHDPTPPGSEDEDADLLQASSARRGVGRGKKKRARPSLQDAWGARLLLAEWHVGADPRSYIWTNPYADEEKKKEEEAGLPAESQSQRSGRKGRRKAVQKEESYSATFVAPSSSQFPASSQAFPSAFPSSSFPASSQPFPAFPSSQPSTSTFQPQLPPSSFPAVAFDSQSLSQPRHHLAATQPTISITGPSGDSQSQSQAQSQPFGVGGMGTASQTVPGAFGSRLQALKEKKKAGGGKKRKAGF
ncbi:hypothetical protein JCM8097_006086 [Rhodosporidiobolus ruineniae]